MTGRTGPAAERSAQTAPASAAFAAATLSVLAFPRPALAVIAAAPTFLVAHSTGPREVALLLVLGCVLLPAVVAALAWVAASYGGRGTRAVLYGALGLLTTLAAMAMVGRAQVPGAWAAALVLGVLFAWHYPRRPTLRWVTTALSPALLAVPLAFAFHPDVRRATAVAEGIALEPVEASAPVVLVVLDEWSFGSLLDAEWVLGNAIEGAGESADWAGALDRDRLPRLARFAEGATWFANARAISDATELAVPAVLTGRFPRPDALPVLADHPDNLFTRLGGSYRVVALEPVGALCPPGIDRQAGSEPGAGPRIRSLLGDVVVVWLHAVTPPVLERRLPPISQKWSGFLEPDAGEGVIEERAAGRLDEAASAAQSFRARPDSPSFDRAESFRQFLASIEPGDRQLYFAHLLLPHVPLEYLPSGDRYLAPQSRLLGLENDRWSDDQRLADQALQRYLLQVSFVDLLLGELFDRLEQADLFDDTLIVLTSDHGASFRAGTSRRMFEPANAPDVVPLPLFVKLPGQRKGAVRLEPVTVLDVLPTVLEAIGLEPGPGLDGRSLVTPPGGGTAPHTRRFYAKHRGDVYFTAADDPGEQRLLATRRQAELLLDAGGDPFLIGLPPILAERRVVAAGPLEAASGSRPHAVLEGGAVGASMASVAEQTGGLIEGALRSAVPSETCCSVAVARGGELVAAAPIYAEAGRGMRFSVLLPRTERGPAGESVVLYRVDRLGALHPISVAGESARLEFAPDGELVAVTVDGRRYPADPGVLGFLEHVATRAKFGQASGWATDRTAATPPERVLFFVDGEMVGSSPVDRARQGVARGGDDAMATFGFDGVFPLADPARLRRSGLVAVAISGEHSASLGFFYRELARGLDRSVTVVATNGREIPVGSESVRGWLDQVHRQPLAGLVGTAESETVRLVGWAADIGQGRRAERVVAFEHGAYLTQAWPGLSRDDLVAAFGPELHDAGFVLGLPRPGASLRDGTIELVAIGRGGGAAFIELRPELFAGPDEPDGPDGDAGRSGPVPAPPRSN
ncbi:MAG TPA: sulfatase-like hydrolase/transferase [Thermoanaerobaculia bacterium]|nr:sulfatase-like hydrolase/transferase [Thermoanaerobaculia bacterium]